MSWLGFKRTLTKPVTEHNLRKQLKQRFYYKDIMEVLRKREEFRVRLPEAKKSGKSNGDVSKYQYFIDTINWVINSKDDKE